MKITENTFFHNNNLDVLKTLDPESVDLIYMDPPFNANKKFVGKLKEKNKKELQIFFKHEGIGWKDEYESPQFSDVWRKSDVDPYAEFEIAAKNEDLSNYLEMIEKTCHESHFSYLTFMAVRLLECKRVLKKSGSILLHCDQSMSHYIKVLLDITFGRSNFINDIAWCYTGPSSPGMKGFANKHDNIFLYSKGKKTDMYWNWNNDLVGQKYTESSLGAFTSASKLGGERADCINKRKYPENYFNDIPALKNTSERIGYPTQKPLKLLKRLIRGLCPQDGIVMDPFCGCATTCVAAQDLGIKWIGIDTNEVAIGLIKYRMAKEINGWDSESFGTAKLDFGDIPIVNSTRVPEINAKEQESHVYICQERRNGVLHPEKKIGKADNLENRLKQLNGTLSPTEYVFTAAWKVKDGLAVEGKIHEIFKTRRSIGEWFLDETNEIIGFVEGIMPLFNGERVI